MYGYNVNVHEIDDGNGANGGHHDNDTRDGD